MNFHYYLWHQYADQILYGNTANQPITNDDIAAFTFPALPDLPLSENSLSYEVQYPGILTGMSLFSGPDNTENSKYLNGGITLDPVTGIPYLPGSTVKGILRTPFVENPAFGTALLRAAIPDIDWNEENTAAFELAVFGNRPSKDIRQGCDCFLDAFPVFPADRKLLNLETLAVPKPDADKDTVELKQANVLNFLKIRPGVIIRFRFLGNDLLLPGMRPLTIKDRINLYDLILQNMGVGAKTNSGYGNLIKYNPPRRPAATRTAPGPQPHPQLQPNPQSQSRPQPDNQNQNTAAENNAGSVDLEALANKFRLHPDQKNSRRR